MHDRTGKRLEKATRSDVIICGGGLAGLLLARQIRREMPQLSVTVLERTRRPLPDGCHKVGESSVELGSQYLERLGLRDYLREHHLIKLGLRFFPGGGDRPLSERTEIGPFTEPRVRSYQIDRGRFEHDVRGFLEEDGAELIEGAKVKNIELAADGGDHVVTMERDGAEHELSARWVVDATGRAALLRRKLKMTRGSRHEASAAWFRVAGRVDVSDMVPREQKEWHFRPCSDERWRSTNHFMGPGYWTWLIPLATDMTSVGIVVHEEMHDFRDICTLEGALAWLEQHEPHVAKLLEGADVRDFLCLRNYSHSASRCWSPQRWGIVGEAGAFVDPLYSPGTDFIALANCFTMEMLRTDGAGEDLDLKARTLNAQYKAFVGAGLDLFRDAAPVYGHTQAMSAKVFWDNFSYWSFTCQYYQQEIWRLTGADHAPFDEVGRVFLELGIRVQKLLRAWAELAPPRQEKLFRPMPALPSVLIDAHVSVAQRMCREDTLRYMQERAAQAREIAGEIALRIVQELGPELAAQCLERAGFSLSEVALSPERIELEGLGSLQRRHRLPEIARDLERSLAGVRRHPDAERARDLLISKSTV